MRELPQTSGNWILSAIEAELWSAAAINLIYGFTDRVLMPSPVMIARFEAVFWSPKKRRRLTRDQRIWMCLLLSEMALAEAFPYAP